MFSATAFALFARGSGGVFATAPILTGVVVIRAIACITAHFAAEAVFADEAGHTAVTFIANVIKLPGVLCSVYGLLGAAGEHNESAGRKREIK